MAVDMDTYLEAERGTELVFVSNPRTRTVGFQTRDGGRVWGCPLTALKDGPQGLQDMVRDALQAKPPSEGPKVYDTDQKVCPVTE